MMALYMLVMNKIWCIVSNEKQKQQKKRKDK